MFNPNNHERVWETDIFTFDELPDRLRDVTEKYGHIDTITLIIDKGNFNLFYTKPKNN